MYTNDYDCLYDGFKIRICDVLYVSMMLKKSEDYGIEKLYYRNNIIKYPFYGNYLGCTRTKENAHSKGFQIGFIQESRNNKTVTCVEISGSLHKFANNWNHNSNSISFNDAIESIRKIKELFNIPDEIARVCKLEIGKNIIITPDFNTSSKELASNVLFAKNRSKKENKTNKDRNDSGHSFYLENETTKSKIYAKSFQQREYSNNQEIIRIESVLCKSRAIKKTLGINHLDDLAISTIHTTARKYFQKRFQHLFFYQKEIEHANVSPDEKMRLLEFSKEEYWQGLYKTNKREFLDNKKQYFSILDKNNIPNISRFILKEINEAT